MKSLRYAVFTCLCALWLFSVSSYAGDICNEPNYPDQYDFEDCEDASELSWDWENSDMELSPSSSGTVRVTGGQSPYTWTVSGSGFYLDEEATQTTIITDNPAITIYTNAACGPCDVTITDGCGTTVENSVRSSDGEWVQISDSTQVSGLMAIPHTDMSTVYTCADGNNVWCITYSSSGPTYKGTGENGRYRVINSRYHKYYGSSGSYASCADCSEPYYGRIDDVPGFPYDWCWEFGGSKPYNCDYIKYRKVYEWQCN